VRTLRAALGALLFLILLAGPLDAYALIYAEDYYELYHRHLNQSTDDIMENIIWLERALSTDFRNPLYALGRVETAEQWARYRALFRMHVNLELIKLYRTFGSKYQKVTAYFFNYPWKRQNLESLDTAETLYRQAYYYWSQARQVAAEAWTMRSQRLEGLEAWVTEDFRIVTGALDYQKILDSDLRKIQKVRADFQSMGAGTY